MIRKGIVVFILFLFSVGIFVKNSSAQVVDMKIEPVVIDVDQDLRLGSLFDYKAEHYGVFELQRNLSRVWRTQFNVREKFYKEAGTVVPPAPRIDFDKYSVIWYSLKGSGASFVKSIDVRQTPNEIIVTFHLYHSDFGSNRLNLWKIPKIEDKKFIFIEEHEYEEKGP